MVAGACGSWRPSAVPAINDVERATGGGVLLGPLLRPYPRPVCLSTEAVVRLVREQRAGPLAGIQRAHVELYVRQLGDQGLMDSSVVTMMHAVRGYFRFAHIDGLILHLVGKGTKPATMPLTVPVLRVLEACRGQQTSGPLILRPVSGKPIDRRDAYRMVARIAKAAGIPRHISPHSLRHAAITNALDAGVPLRDAQILARHANPRTTEH